MERRIDPIPALSPRSRWEPPEQAQERRRGEARRRGRERRAQGERGEPVDRCELSPGGPEPLEEAPPEPGRGSGASGHIDVRA